jgi:hypothetical protein
MGKARQPCGRDLIVNDIRVLLHQSSCQAINQGFLAKLFSWNPSVTGNVGRMVEIYNPNPLMTFGGMGSNKLAGPNIEYIRNNDSHPGAQFNSEFHSLVN